MALTPTYSFNEKNSAFVGFVNAFGYDIREIGFQHSLNSSIAIDAQIQYRDYSGSEDLVLGVGFSIQI